MGQPQQDAPSESNSCMLSLSFVNRPIGTWKFGYCTVDHEVRTLKLKRAFVFLFVELCTFGIVNLLLTNVAQAAKGDDVGTWRSLVIVLYFCVSKCQPLLQVKIWER